MKEQMKPSGIDWIGDIPNAWKMQRFKFCGAVLYGYPFDSDFFTNEETGVPLIRIRDITSGTVSTYYEGNYSPEYIVHSGDVLVGMDGDFNVRIWDNVDALLNQRCCKILSSEKISARFLAYYLPHLLYIINQLAWSTTVKHLLAEDIGNIPVVYPSLNEQQTIADYLDKECAQIDSIAADLEKQIALLQQYKKSLITETVTKGLDKSVPMKDSGIEWFGEIPAHWDVEPIKYRVTFHNGDRGENYPSKSELQSEGIPFINAGHLEGDGFNMDNMDYISEEKYRIMGGVKLRSGDILYCLRGSVGKNAIVDMNQGTVASSLVAIRSVRISAEYLYYCLNSYIEEVQRYLWDNGTAQPNLSADSLGKYKICIPTVEEQRTIVKYLNNICSQIDNLIIGKRKQLSTIQQHKKSLIYEYVTGKKRVKEVQ